MEDLCLIRGPQGPQGPQGETGPQGPQGDPGADGADGADYSSNAMLAALSALTPAADRLPYTTDGTTAALATLTAAGRALLDDADAATQRETLGVPPSTRTISTTAPLTGGGDLSEDRTISLGTQDANKVLAGPTSGSAAAADFRALVSDDIPALAASKITSGTLDSDRLPTVPTSKGGTGLTGVTAGDILYASATDTLSKLAKGTDGQVLTLASGLPSWADASGGGGGGSWELVDEIVTTSAVGSVSFTGLDGDADGVYMVLAQFQNVWPVNGIGVVLKPNGLSSNVTQRVSAGGAVYTNEAGPIKACTGGDTNHQAWFQMRIQASKSLGGVAVRRSFQTDGLYLDNQPYPQPFFCHASWNETSTNLTSLVFESQSGSSAASIGAGSRFLLYKVNA